MTKGVMRERHAPLTEEELDAVTVVFHQFETGLREGTIYTKVSIRHYMEEELDAVTVVFHQFETGLREVTIYTKVRINIFCARQSAVKNKTTKQLSFVVL
jgi:hypothetical protein